MSTPLAAAWAALMGPYPNLAEVNAGLEARVAELQLRFHELQDRNQEIIRVYAGFWTEVRMEVGALVDGVEGLCRSLREGDLEDRVHGHDKMFEPLKDENTALKTGNEAMWKGFGDIRKDNNAEEVAALKAENAALKRDNRALGEANETLEGKWRNAEDKALCAHEQWCVSHDALSTKMLGLARENDRLDKVVKELEAKQLKIQNHETEKSGQNDHQAQKTRIQTGVSAPEGHLRAELADLRRKCEQLEQRRDEPHPADLDHLRTNVNGTPAPKEQKLNNNQENSKTLVTTLTGNVNVLKRTNTKLRFQNSDLRSDVQALKIENANLNARVSGLKKQKAELRDNNFELAAHLDQTVRKLEKALLKGKVSMEGEIKALQHVGLLKKRVQQLSAQLGGGGGTEIEADGNPAESRDGVERRDVIGRFPEQDPEQTFLEDDAGETEMEREMESSCLSGETLSEFGGEDVEWECL